MFDNIPKAVVNGFAMAGVVSVAPLIYRLLSFIWIYFIRPSSLKIYLTGPAPYALITGASDGIGKAVAKARLGFDTSIYLSML